AAQNGTNNLPNTPGRVLVPGQPLPGRPLPPNSQAAPQNSDDSDDSDDSTKPAAAPTALANGEVILNYPAADVHDIAKSILGDTLGLNYAVDPAASGNVTVETANPVKRADVLPVFEQSLKAAKLGLIKRGDVYTIVPLEQARKQAQLLNNGQPG